MQKILNVYIIPSISFITLYNLNYVESDLILTLYQNQSDNSLNIFNLLQILQVKTPTK